MPAHIPLLSVETDEPKVMLAVGLYGPCSHEPTGVTLLGLGADYDALVESVMERFDFTDDRDPWMRKSAAPPDGPAGNQFSEIVVVEVPASNPRFELTLDDVRSMGQYDAPSSGPAPR